MPQSRKRRGHKYHPPADIPPRQRVTGRIFWAILLAIFGLLIAFFAAGENYIFLAVGTLIGAFAGYLIGANMEKDATHKT